MTAQKEAFRECLLRLNGAREQISEMEQLIAQGLAASRRGEVLCSRWQEHAQSALRLLQEDVEETSDV